MPTEPASMHRPETAGLADAFGEALQCGVAVVGRDGRVLAANAEAERLLQSASPEENRTKQFEALPRVLGEVVEETFRGGQNVANSALVLKSGGGLTVGVSTVLIPQREFNAEAVVLLLHDLSPFSAIEWRMLRLNRLASAGMLSAGVAHEIKNALVSVKTFVDSVVKGVLDAGFSSLVTREIERINGLVGQMLKFSTTVGAQEYMDLEVHGVVSQTIRLVEKHAAESGIQVHKAFKADFDTVRASASQLEQALINLFLNAFAAMPKGGELRLATENVSHPGLGIAPSSSSAVDCICLTVSDTGCGMAPEVMRQIFQPFFTTKADGSGLGLSIVERIIRDHQGVVSVESSLGQGSTFRILLPLSGT